MVAAAVVAPSALLPKDDVLAKKAFSQLADWQAKKMDEAFFAVMDPNVWVELKSAEGAEIFKNSLFTGAIGRYDGVNIYTSKRMK